METVIINTFCDNAKSHILELERIVWELKNLKCDKMDLEDLNIYLTQANILFDRLKK